jgi:small-conductance mechanosensitive channel
MHPRVRNLTLVGLAVLLIAVLIGFVRTRPKTDSGLSKQLAANGEQAQAKLVDQSPLVTAHSLADVASTVEEQKLAAQAITLADHEVDLAFAAALQQTQLHPPADNTKTRELNARIRTLDAHLQEAQEQTDRLTKLAANPGKNDAHAIQQQLEIAQARVALLEDALDDAKEDLLRAGGDPQAEIKQELEEHEALQHGSGNTSGSLQPKPISFEVAENLLGQFRAWRQLRNNQARLLEAQKKAEAYAATLNGKHDALQKGLSTTLTDDRGSEESAATNAPASDQEQHTAKMAKIHDLSQSAKVLAGYDKRIQAEQQLAALYGQWNEIVSGQRRAALHAILRSLLWILLALIGLALVERLLERFYLQLGHPDRRRLGTMRLVLRSISQIIGVLIILMVLFGPPSQLSTVVALAAAGLTVALKDFIVAFFGWFILMGRHGIRAGDWVEINGIGGEVVEVGLLRTILLETGNWNDAGHPTGRKVSFVNSFAIEGHYFNFTTAGQWLWDELDILIPAGEDPYRLTNSVLALVSEQTQADATAAEQEWRRVAPHSAIQTFSAAPAINVRPTNLGINLVVRYIATANKRYEVRTRLYQAIVELLSGTKAAQADEKRVPAQP